MKRVLFAVASAAMVAVSCQQDFTEVPQLKNEVISELNSTYAISEQEAIDRLEEFMKAFEEDETRAGSRVIKSISPVSYSDICGDTRSSMSEEIEDLVYIVEFENGEGSAVMGADRRVEPVYALLDETVLTVDDFNNAVNGENLDDISTYTAGLIAQNAMSRITADVELPGDDFRTDVTYYTTTTTVLNKVFPLLRTKWDQDEPYNNKFPFTSNGLIREPAGCGTIAVAQVLANLTYPYNIVLNGHSHDWSIISQFQYGASITNPYHINCLAQFIYDLAIEMNADYGDGGENDFGTVVPVSESVALFQRLGFKNVSFEDITSTKVYNMIWNNKPLYAYGVDTRKTEANVNVAHAWVIDGWKETRTIVREIVEDNGVIISNTVCDNYYTQYGHCNYGWGGKCDGYYPLNIFNTRTAPSDNMIETDDGDYKGTDRWVFSEDLKMIKYNY